MPDLAAPKPPKAVDVLFGRKAAEKPPALKYRQTVHLTPDGTETRMEPTPEGRAYLAKLAREKAQNDRLETRMADAPRAPRRSLGNDAHIKQQNERLNDTFDRTSKSKHKGP